ncbi:MAG: hypothetical protein ABW006_04370 [Hyphomicrobium sp.]|jgi:hypothetical protein
MVNESADRVQADIDLVLKETFDEWPGGDPDVRRAYVAASLARTALKGDPTLNEFRHAARNAVSELIALEYLRHR